MKRKGASEKERPTKKKRLGTTVAECQLDELQQFTCEELKNYLQANELDSKGNKKDLVDRAHKHKSVADFFCPSSAVHREGTVFQTLLPDLFPHIHSYCVHNKRFQDRGSLKASYEYQYKITHQTQVVSFHGLAFDGCGNIFTSDR